MPKAPMSFRFDVETVAAIEALQRFWGLPRGKVVVKAIISTSNAVLTSQKGLGKENATKPACMQPATLGVESHTPALPAQKQHQLQKNKTTLWSAEKQAMFEEATENHRV